MWRFLYGTNRYKPRNQSNGVETIEESKPQFLRAPRSLPSTTLLFFILKIMGFFMQKHFMVLLTCMLDRRPHSMLRRLLRRRVPGASCTWSWSCPPGRACLLCKSSRHHQKGSEAFKTRVTKADFSEQFQTGKFLGIREEAVILTAPFNQDLGPLENNNKTELRLKPRILFSERQVQGQ